MSNILLVNANVQDYNIIINSCNDITYAITYNQQTDTYATIFTKYEKLVSENNIQILNHLALVSHGSYNPEFTFLEKENKMLISKYLVDPSVRTAETMTSPSENVENEIPVPIAGPDEDILPLADEEPEDILPLADEEPEDISDTSFNSMNKFIINNLDTLTTFKEFIKKFDIQISLDFLGCALLQSSDWKYVLETLKTEQHLHLTIRASDDATGNLKVGADWVLESDNVNIKGLYFNGESIEKWNYTLTLIIYNFTNLNGGGSYTGPTSNAGYNGTTLQGLTTIVGGIQEWNVPTSGSYIIEAWGASGGDGTIAGDGHGLAPHASSNRYGGKGRYVKITTTLTQGTVIYILVGQGGHRNYTRCGGGGGGTFVTTAKGSSASTSDILVIAGGGGGGGRGYNGATGQSPEINARLVGANGGYSRDYHTNGNINLGGTGGSGGQYASGGTRRGQGSTGGGGFLSDGTIGYYSRTQDVGKSFRSGGLGGQGSVSGTDYGGFGGGGSQPHQNHVGGGGGGGYNGGAPGGNYNGAWSGGGGSSYAAVTPDIDIEWADTPPRRSIVSGPGRHGKVSITFAPQTPINSSNVSLSNIKQRYIDHGTTDAEGHSYLTDGSTTSAIKLSYFRGATFTDNTHVYQPISISNFKNKIFGFSNVITPDKWRFYSRYSNQSIYLMGDLPGVNGRPNTQAKLYQPQASYPDYFTMFISFNNSSSVSPGIIVDRLSPKCIDEATIWMKVVSWNNYIPTMLGLIKKDYDKATWDDQIGINAMDTISGSFGDRFCFLTRGYHTYAGSRDDIVASNSSYEDPIAGTYDPALTKFFHNRYGVTQGTQLTSSCQSVSNKIPSSATYSNGWATRFLDTTNTNLPGYPGFTSTSILPYIGLKLKWYETTIQASLQNDWHVIMPVGGSFTSGNSTTAWSNASMSDVFSGMYVSGTGIPEHTLIGDIYSNYMIMYQEQNTESVSTKLPIQDATSTESNVTLTINGYLYWTLTTDPHDAYVNPKYFGPPHTVLPRYQLTSGGAYQPTTEWAFYIGDTTSGTTNDFKYDTVDTEPLSSAGARFSYEPITYSLASSTPLYIPPVGIDIYNAFYEICERGIVDPTYQDYTGNYDVGEVQQSYTGSARIYIAGKVTSSTTYINDICIAGVQWLDSSGTVKQTWNFSGNVANGNADWSTTTTRISGTSALYSTYTVPSDVVSFSYSWLSTSYDSGGDRWFLASSTGSSYTGMADGISSTTTTYNPGINQISQSTGTQYLYNETSGASRYYSTVLKGPSISLVGGDKIRVAHACVISSGMGSSFNANDSIWIGIQ